MKAAVNELAHDALSPGDLLRLSLLIYPMNQSKKINAEKAEGPTLRKPWSGNYIITLF